jgi:hypothetical protein
MSRGKVKQTPLMQHEQTSRLEPNAKDEDKHQRGRCVSLRAVPSGSGYCLGLLPGYEFTQITQQVVAQFGEAVDFLLRVDCVLLAQLLRFLFGRRKRVQVPGKAPGTREEIGNLSLSRSVEQIQSARIGFVNREFRQCESAEFVKVFVGPDLHILKLPNFFKALHIIYYGCDLSDESCRKASSRTAASKKTHGFLPLRLFGDLSARAGSELNRYLNSKNRSRHHQHGDSCWRHAHRKTPFNWLLDR